eukprot:m.19600 g.19600  ORF g.19600 m.19600 type:complete len:541 (+) comp12536_c0_seq1:241-1863(+)
MTSILILGLVSLLAGHVSATSENAGKALDNLFNSLGSGLGKQPNKDAGSHSKVCGEMTAVGESVHDIKWLSRFSNSGNFTSLWGSHTFSVDLSINYNLVDSLESLCTTCESTSESCHATTRPSSTVEGCVQEDVLASSTYEPLAEQLKTIACEFASDGANGIDMCVSSAEMVSSEIHVDQYGDVLLPQAGPPVGADKIGLTGILTLGVSDSSINSNMIHLNDPRMAAHIYPLPRYFGHAIPSLKEMRPGTLLFVPSFVQRSIYAHGDPDEPRSYLIFTIAVPTQFSTTLSSPVTARVQSNSTGDSAGDGAGDNSKHDTGDDASNAWWNTPIMHAVGIISAESSLRSTLVNAMLQFEQHDRGVYKSNKGGWQSRDLKRLNQTHPEEIEELISLIHVAIVEFLKYGAAGSVTASEKAGAVVDVHVKEAWVGINRNQHSNAPHVHPRSVISGVVYLQTPAWTNNQSGRLVLRDPRGHVATGWNSHTHAIQPKTGDIVLFPSWLEHYVEPHREDEARIVVSFNANVDQQDKMSLSRNLQVCRKG